MSNSFYTITFETNSMAPANIVISALFPSLNLTYVNYTSNKLNRIEIILKIAFRFGKQYKNYAQMRLHSKHYNQITTHITTICKEQSV